MPVPIETVQIEKLVQGGAGLGRSGRRVVFVPYTIPREQVTIKIVREKGDYAEGIVEEVVCASPHRRTPPCPVFGVCGGCQLQHLPEKLQIEYKISALTETLQRIGGIDPAMLLPPVTAPDGFHYRSRVRLKVEKGKIGFYQNKSHLMVPISHCPILIPSLNHTLSLLQKEAPLTSVNEIEIQGDEEGGGLIIFMGRNIPYAAVEQFYKSARKKLTLHGVIVYTQHRRYCFGRDYLVHSLFGQTVRIHDRSFSQIHSAMNRLLTETVIAWIAPTSDDHILEIYSGAGNFTLALAGQAKWITAIEANPIAYEDARTNMQKAGRKNVSCVRASVDTGLKKILLHPKGKYHKALLNPPREGVISQMSLMMLSKLSLEKIFYISCNPATFARDAKILSNDGYCVTRLQPFDMFPQTGQIELLAELVRRA